MDLTEAYDSVPCLALWKVLEKYGIPPSLHSITKSLHDGMKAEVKVGKETTSSIDVCNGLRQGCTYVVQSLLQCSNSRLGKRMSSSRYLCKIQLGVVEGLLVTELRSLVCRNCVYIQNLSF